jgi:hypothetical protein
MPRATLAEASDVGVVRRTAAAAAPPAAPPPTSSKTAGSVSSAIRAIVMPSPVPGSVGAASAAGALPVAPEPSSAVSAVSAVSLDRAPLPRGRRVGSLADVGEPIPLTWIVRSGVVIGVVIVLAIGLAIATHCRGSEPKPRPAASMGSGGSGAPAASTTHAASGSGSSAAKPDRDAQLGAAIRALEGGKTCADRRAGVARLVELRDPRAVASLKRAIARTGSGDDGNACLKADGERAIRELATPHSSPRRAR